MSTWGVPELQGADFDYDFEDKIIEYIYNNYQASDPAKGSAPQPDYESEPNRVSFKAGFPDFFRPYEICCVQTRTEFLERINPKFVFATGLDIMVRMKRLNRDAIDVEPQLENLENEVQRIIEHYRPNEVIGIKDLVYNENPSVQRVYNARDSFARADWRSIIRIKVFYEKEDLT